MKQLNLTDAQYDVLIEALDWAVDAAETDIGDEDNDKVTVYEELKKDIVQEQFEQRTRKENGIGE